MENHSFRARAVTAALFVLFGHGARSIALSERELREQLAARAQAVLGDGGVSRELGAVACDRAFNGFTFSAGAGLTAGLTAGLSADVALVIDRGSRPKKLRAQLFLTPSASVGAGNAVSVGVAFGCEDPRNGRDFFQSYGGYSVQGTEAGLTISRSVNDEVFTRFSDWIAGYDRAADAARDHEAIARELRETDLATKELGRELQPFKGRYDSLFNDGAVEYEEVEGRKKASLRDDLERFLKDDRELGEKALGMLGKYAALRDEIGRLSPAERMAAVPRLFARFKELDAELRPLRQFLVSFTYAMKAGANQGALGAKIAELDGKLQREEARETERRQELGRPRDAVGEARANLGAAKEEVAVLRKLFANDQRKYEAVRQLFFMLGDDVADARHGRFDGERKVGGVPQVSSRALTDCTVVSMPPGGLRFSENHLHAPPEDRFLRRGATPLTLSRLKERLRQLSPSFGAGISYSYTPQDLKDTTRGLVDLTGIFPNNGQIEIDLPESLQAVFPDCEPGAPHAAGRADDHRAEPAR